MKKKALLLSGLVVVALSAGVVGCGEQPSTTTTTGGDAAAVEVKEVEMSYISTADLKGNIANSEYLVLDVRKAADFEAGHIAGSISADMDAAKEGDAQAGVETMAAAMLAQCGNISGADQKIVLVCYSGKRYAQCATNSLAALGANMDNVYTLEGGMKAWEEAGYAVEK